MISEQNYEKAIEIVRSSIHSIDPYALLEGGAPEDEFDSEIQKIVAQSSKWGSAQDVAATIAFVLSASFNEEFQGKDFKIEGQVIYSSFESNGLL